MKNQFRFKNLPDAFTIRGPASKLYVDHKFNDRSISKKRCLC